MSSYPWGDVDVPRPSGAGALAELRTWGRVLAHLGAVTYLAALVFLAAWVAVPTAALGLAAVAIDSGSMGPTLDPGDVVLLRPLGDTDARVGQVVTYRTPEAGLVTHRVVSVRDDGTLATKGDANTDADARAVERDDVVGVGRFVVPAAGLPAHWVRTSPLRLLAWVACTLVAVGVAFRVRPPLPSLPTRTEDDEDVTQAWSWPDERGGA